MSTDADGPIEAAREHEPALEAVAGRDDRLGAFARVAIALAHGEDPDPSDLETVGLPRNLGGTGGRR